MNKYIKILIGITVGGLAGYAYYYFIGCNGGGCPITSNWHISTLYGAVAGLLIALPGKKTKIKSNDNPEK